MHVNRLQPLYNAGLSQQEQCFSEPGCNGTAVKAPGPSARDCCAGTNDGQSYGLGLGNCEINQCIGKTYNVWSHYYVSCFVVHGFENATYDLDESSILQTFFQLNVKGETNIGGLIMAGRIAAVPGGTASKLFLLI